MNEEPASLATTRRVAACLALDGPDAVRLQDEPLAAPGPGELRLRIEACGVNFPDLLMTRGRYQLKLSPPFVPGMEAAGRIEALGAGVRGFSIGERVIAHRDRGLYATAANVAADDVHPAPTAFSMPEAAAYRVAAITAWHALVDRAQLKPGESVLVLGAGGGVGLAAVEMAALLGAQVIAAASSEERLAAARARGAHALLDYTRGNLVESVRALRPEGIDVILDPVGGELFEQALRLPAWNGRVLVVGFASGRIGRIPANLPLIKGYAVLGVRAGEARRRDPSLAQRAERELAQWSARGHLRPLVSRTLPLASAGDALRALERRSAVGRLVLLPQESGAAG